MNASISLRKLLFTTSFVLSPALFCSPSAFAMDNSIERDSHQLPRVRITDSFPAQDYVVENAESKTAPKPIVDILSVSEEEQMQILQQIPYLGDAIFKAKTEEKEDLFQKEIFRIDPRCFLLPAEVVRKWYYTRYYTYERMPLETYEGLDKSTLKPFIFNRFFNFPTDPDERRIYYRNNPIGFLDQELIGWNLAAARRILRFATSQDRVIIFGNTPYFLGRGIEFLTKERQKLDASYLPPKLIYLPFSGAPNVESTRNATGFTKDVVTPDRLAHFQRRLKNLGLSSENPELLEGTTYIVDVIGAGSGPSFTMETILRNFRQDVSDDRLPDFEVISLNTFKEDDPRHTGIASFPAKDGDHLELHFPNKYDTAFIVPAQVIYVSGHGMLDKGPSLCPSMRMVPEYNPCYWSEEFDYLLSAPPTSLQVIIEEHFQENLRALIEKGYTIM